ncbi:maleylpyruvate isomerase family mycothiol-dependent enzyme [Amycolatopsis sp. K13G38]|uniref:Maleylpyruvate isomerase family mycothiol-dependent enzyme n=1 Tax=Amycolatopsis acididurans TaxID=2724524 RepID=A0ABX1J1L4_9PSEU|nr:maleylpyruvate isomerase family mycothiol-dependent enzyme [Amycolatopsis acididurans]NKQ53661.1 maleylpyruvate isomerase family mycothiol-dependent enzyme [Amycolatopsis acididurans]
MDTKRLAIGEREDFAAFLDTLAPEQWREPSLCTGWSVRDVVAHVISYDELGGRALLSRFARGRFTLGGVNGVGTAEYTVREPRELIELLRRFREPRGLTAAFGSRIALLDALIHQQDIRRPLGLPRQIPEPRLRAALGFARIAPPIGAFWRARGLRLVATDVGWSAGRGPELRGPGEALLMAIAGRGHAVGELDGPGRDVLAGRLGV